MISTGNPSDADGGDDLHTKMHTYLAGKAYIAVLKHQLVHGMTSDRRLTDVYDEAYREAAALACRELPGSRPSTDKVHTYIVAKAYIAVLKHQLANPMDSGRPLRDVFDEAYREAAAPARCEPLDLLEVDHPKPSSP